ncbi:hypothetical protein [Brevibacillus sp. 179-C9.3 HS]|uniref:hypothetical protein n=1 Tax=unclassified Brevibacillus TaxID=2684853 RepID=UPI0039A0B4BB
MHSPENNLQKHTLISIPSLDQLKEIAKRSNYLVDESLSPDSEFAFLNPKTKAGVAAMMTTDHSLISIDLYVNNDPTIVPFVSEVLNLYLLPVDNLAEDVTSSYNDRKEFERHYDYYWVQYMPIEEDPEVVLIRYRRFVEE